jgi:DNA-binding transcriptional regulator GbsR (MarR family)
MTPERRYAEEVGMMMSQMGMPPAYGKLLGWLLICDPPSQTSAQLAEALGLSKGSISTGMRMLERSGLVQRVPVPGRGHAYEMAPDALVRATDPGGRFRLLRDVMDNGLKILGDPDAPRAQRLKFTRDFYAFVAERIPELIEEFQHGRNPGNRD